MSIFDRTFTFTQVETILCVWECIDDWTLNRSDKQDWKALREAVGTTEMRLQSIELASWCERIYLLCRKKDDLIFDAYAFDWEVIPAILEHACDADGPIVDKSSLPPVVDVAVKVFIQFWRESWMQEAKSAAIKRYAYADLIADHLGTAECAFRARETPEKFVAWLGGKYGLTPRGDFA